MSEINIDLSTLAISCLLLSKRSHPINKALNDFLVNDSKDEEEFYEIINTLPMDLPEFWQRAVVAVACLFSLEDLNELLDNSSNNFSVISFYKNCIAK